MVRAVTPDLHGEANREGRAMCRAPAALAWTPISQAARQESGGSPQAR